MRIRCTPPSTDSLRTLKPVPIAFTRPQSVIRMKLHRSSKQSHRNQSTYLFPDLTISFHFPNSPILACVAYLSAQVLRLLHGAHFSAPPKTSVQTAHSFFWLTTLRPPN